MPRIKMLGAHSQRPNYYRLSVRLDDGYEAIIPVGGDVDWENQSFYDYLIELTERMREERRYE